MRINTEILNKIRHELLVWSDSVVKRHNLNLKSNLKFQKVHDDDSCNKPEMFMYSNEWEELTLNFESGTEFICCTIGTSTDVIDGFGPRPYIGLINMSMSDGLIQKGIATNLVKTFNDLSEQGLLFGVVLSDRSEVIDSVSIWDRVFSKFPNLYVEEC